MEFCHTFSRTRVSVFPPILCHMPVHRASHASSLVAASVTHQSRPGRWNHSLSSASSEEPQALGSERFSASSHFLFTTAP